MPFMKASMYNDQASQVGFQLSLLQLAMIPGPNGTSVVSERVKQEVKELEQYVDAILVAARR